MPDRIPVGPLSSRRVSSRRSELGRIPALAALATVSILAASAGPLVAGPTRIVTAASARDFLAGEAYGVAVTADGRLALGPALAERAWPEDASDAVVFGAASDGAGRVFVATGGGLGRLFASAPGGAVELVFTAPEPNVTAVAVAPDGTIVCATAPNGKVYRVDLKERDAEKAGSVLADPKEAAIWALAFGADGSLVVGTGNKGRVFSKPPKGELALLAEVEDTLVRSLAVGPDGTVYAGTSEKALVLAIAPGTPSAVVRTLHDFNRPEVSALALRGDGALYAAASSVEVPALGAPRFDPRRLPVPSPTPASGAPPPSDEPRATVSVSTGPPRLASVSVSGREGSADVVLIAPDGFVEPAWSFPDEAVYALRWAGPKRLGPKTESAVRDFGSLLVATGPRGRVYSLADRSLTLLTQTEQKQVVAVPPVRDAFAPVTMASPGLFRPLGSGLKEKGAPARYLSAIKDAGRASRLGALRFEGDVPKGASARFFVRAGNSSKPDGTWSAWRSAPADGTAAGSSLPVARYFQWKVELAPSPEGASPSLSKVEFAYAERNARPILESVSVLEPGAVYPRGGASSSAVLSVTNPDELGIYSGLESPRDASPEGPGKKLWRKGYRTIQWKASDPNGDALRFDVEGVSLAGGPSFAIRRDLDDQHLSFDSTSLPDGRYAFTVSASDRAANADGEGLTDRETTETVVVDNTPPRIEIESVKAEGDELVLRAAASDASSPLTKAEGALNADRWRLLVAEDGATDSPKERFVLRVKKPAGGAILSLRVVDASGNVAAATAVWPPKGSE